MLGFGFAGVLLAIVVASYPSTEYQLVCTCLAAFPGWRELRPVSSLRPMRAASSVLWERIGVRARKWHATLPEATAVCAFEQGLCLFRTCGLPRTIWLLHH